ncbi:MAG: tetratricopeptide repeat protein [Bacteroidales bacterium]|nr:tetratricopeptide repeat protein [Bacteroidales bacterium]
MRTTPEDRFRNYDDDVREIVLDFESSQKSGMRRYYDTDEMEIIIDFYMDMYDMDQVEYAVRYAENLFPESIGIRVRRAILLINKGQHDKALPILQELHRTEPDNTEVLFALGVIYSAMGQPIKSIQAYIAASRDNNSLEIIYYNIAIEYRAMNRDEEAIHYYKKAIAENDEYVDAMHALADTYYDCDRTMDSVQYFLQLAQDKPYNKEAWFLLAEGYHKLSLYEKAIDAAEYARTIDKEFTPAYMIIADCYRDMNQPGKATSILLECKEYSKNPEWIYYLIGTLFFYSNPSNIPVAISYYRKAIEIDPCQCDALHDLALCFDSMNDYGTATHYIDRAIDAAPPLAEYHFDAAQIHMHNLDPEKAEEHFKMALDLDNSKDDYWLLYAIFLYASMRYQEAIELLAVGINSTDEQEKYDAIMAACHYKKGEINLFKNIALNYYKDDGTYDQLWMKALMHICPESKDILP